MVKADFELTSRGLALEKFIKQAGKQKMVAGFINEDDEYPDGEKVAAVAYDNEYGVVQNNQPPRPFMRPALASGGKKWIKMFGGSIDGIFRGGLDIVGIYGMLGDQVVDDIRAKIKAVNSPKLAPMTIAMRQAKGNDSIKPLEDTHQMYNSVKSKVENK